MSVDDLSPEAERAVEDFLDRRSVVVSRPRMRAAELDLEGDRFGLTVHEVPFAFLRRQRGRDHVTVAAGPHRDELRRIGAITRSQAEKRGMRVTTADHDTLADYLGMQRMHRGDPSRSPAPSSEAARERRRAEFFHLYQRAHAAGLKAADGAAPRRLIVEPGERWENETDVKGFAWANVSPGNSGFGAWLVRSGVAHASYSGGVDVYAPGLGTALAPQDAYAAMFARIVREAGVTCRARDRLD